MIPELHNYIDAGFDQRDKDHIDQCVSRQAEIYVAYRRAADDHDVDPEPVPHIHDEHEEKTDRCKTTMVLSHTIGALIGFWWSYEGSAHSIPISISAILLYATVATILDLSCVALAPRGSFCRNFWKWVVPVVPVTLASSSILLAERFASPDIATLLLRWDTSAWLGLEISMLIVGAVSMVGQRRFGWSGMLTREYQALDSQLMMLRCKIDGRRRAATPSQGEQAKAHKHDYVEKTPLRADVVCVLLAALFGLLATAADACPAVFHDQTGSVADQDLKEDRLSAALAVGITRMSSNSCLYMTPFSANPFSAATREIAFSPLRPTMFGPMREAQGRQMQLEALNKIRASLRPRLPIASCTNIADVLVRAARAPDDALVYTDGKHDCSSPPQQGIASEHLVVVVLVRSRLDGESDSATFSKRQATIKRVMPKAIVLPEFDLDRAVRILFRKETPPAATDTAL